MPSPRDWVIGAAGALGIVAALGLAVIGMEALADWCAECMAIVVVLGLTIFLAVAIATELRDKRKAGDRRADDHGPDADPG